jgi:hypothetical protein
MVAIMRDRFVCGRTMFVSGWMTRAYFMAATMVTGYGDQDLP